jgi:hypothetical protein
MPNNTTQQNKPEPNPPPPPQLQICEPLQQSDNFPTMAQSSLSSEAPIQTLKTKGKEENITNKLVMWLLKIYMSKLSNLQLTTKQSPNPPPPPHTHTHDENRESPTPMRKEKLSRKPRSHMSQVWLIGVEPCLRGATIKDVG